MTQPSNAIYQYIVRELAPSEKAPGEPQMTIVCEPDSASRDRAASGTVTLHLQAGTTREEANSIASTLQAKVKGLYHLSASAEAVH